MYLQSAVESGAARGGVGQVVDFLDPLQPGFSLYSEKVDLRGFNEVPRHTDRRKEKSICGYIWLLNVVYLFGDMFFETLNHSKS